MIKIHNIKDICAKGGEEFSKKEYIAPRRPQVKPAIFSGHVGYLCLDFIVFWSLTWTWRGHMGKRDF